ncbi:ABC transporter substrate-binding protein [Cereibacter sphaeroides]|nr:ABC transporter substrate-binding protein [Cereibacter sphaeroides]
MRNRFLATLSLLALSAATPALSQSHDVTDDAGRSVTLPDRAERLVVMHDPLVGVPLLDIGALVIGAYGRAEDGTNYAGFDFVPLVLGDRAPAQLPSGIGPTGAPDLERLRSLAPDLIIATEYNLDMVDRLATIAPVYVQNVGTGRAEGIEVIRDLAVVTGHEPELQARLDSYHAQVEALRPRLEGGTYLAVLVADQIGAVGTASGLVEAMADLGYGRATLDEAGAFSGPGSNFMAPISTEVFLRLNPDLLIVLGSYGEAQRDEGAVRAALDRVVPGWDRFLRPVREDRVIFLDAALVATPSVAAAEHMVEAVADWADSH